MVREIRVKEPQLSGGKIKLEAIVAQTVHSQKAHERTTVKESAQIIRADAGAG